MTLHIFKWKAISLLLLLSPTAGEWHCTFCKTVSWLSSEYLFLLPTGSEWHSLFCERVPSHHFICMTNRKWVTFHICVRQSHHVFSYDQQRVSDILWKIVSTSFPVINREWVTQHILWKAVSSYFFPMTNSKWVTFHILWKAVSSPFLSLPTGSEWLSTFCERQPHHICSYDQ